MSLCKLMVSDYLIQSGTEGYDECDLKFGISYAEGWHEEGFTHEPFYEFDLLEFAEWCRNKLKGLQ